MAGEAESAPGLRGCPDALQHFPKAPQHAPQPEGAKGQQQYDGRKPDARDEGQRFTVRPENVRDMRDHGHTLGHREKNKALLCPPQRL